MFSLAYDAAAGFCNQFSHLGEDGGGVAAVRLSAPRLLWQLARTGPGGGGAVSGTFNPGLDTKDDRKESRATRLVWDCADLLARLATAPVRLQARAKTHGTLNHGISIRCCPSNAGFGSSKGITSLVSLPHNEFGVSPL